MIHNATQNSLLRSLSDQDFQLIASSLEPIDCPLHFVMAEPNQPAEHIYFLDAGLGSIVIDTPRGLYAEAGLFGSEGFAPSYVALHVAQSPARILMQMPGSGLRMPREEFAASLDASVTLRRRMLRYVQALNIQISYTALCNAVYQVDVRLARWLLMSHDRSAADDLHLTHQFLATMLAVRRPSVTDALHILEGHKLIKADRGYVWIRDRKRLEQYAGAGYGAAEAEYRTLMGAEPGERPFVNGPPPLVARPFEG